MQKGAGTGAAPCRWWPAYHCAAGIEAPGRGFARIGGFAGIDPRPLSFRPVRPRPGSRETIEAAVPRLIERMLADGVEKPTAPAPVRSRCSATRCVSIRPLVFRSLTTKRLHAEVDRARCRGFWPATPTLKYAEPLIRRSDLGPMGRRARRPRSGLRPQWRSWPVPDGRTHRPDCQRDRHDPPQSRFPAADRHRLEPPTSTRWRCRRAIACSSSTSPERPAVAPALPALGRRLPRRAVQHRILRAADDDGGAGDRIEGRRFTSLGDAHLYSNHLDQARLQLTRPTRPLPVMKMIRTCKDIFAFRYRGLRARGL